MERIPRLDAKYLSTDIRAQLLDPQLLMRHLDRFRLAPATGLSIAEFQPWKGYAGTVMVIIGTGFDNDRKGNHVKVGGLPALVVESEPNKLLVITDPRCGSGQVSVTVDGATAHGPLDFETRPWPKPGSGEDGPPFSYAGAGPANSPLAGGVPPTGTANIIVIPSFPTDTVPADLAAEQQTLIDTFANVTTYYDQVSYGALNVQVDVTDFVPLIGDHDTYYRANGAPGYPNFDAAVLAQLMAESAQGAQDQGFDLNNYVVMTAAVYLDGTFVRAWGGWSQDNFAYSDGGSVNINITLDEPVGLIAQGHDADWGRAAHEFAHNMIDGGMVLGEDVYASDLIDGSEATAQNFEMMGNHDSHPLFSGFLMHQLGWYQANNIVDLDWDRNPFSETYELVAHGLSEDTISDRYHLTRIRVSDGLYYFVEVRQRPEDASDPQIFDPLIPLPLFGSPDGGVVVTKVVTGELNNNHQSRLITLLQDDQRIMLEGESAEDPLRALEITVEEDNVQARPRVCRVRVEWAQSIADDPDGQFDLRIEPWGPGYETEDIWIDRNPFGSYDFTDPGGNPVGNGDEPRPLEINRYYARVHNDGGIDATDVKVTYYAINPPGVGDNGNWSPLNTFTHPLVPANGSAEQFVNWVPLVGEHTCLKAAISQQLGEVTGSNNQAQENVFNFQPPSASVPEPVKLTVAVRNPLKEKTIIVLSLDGVPRGYYVYFPHRWLTLEPLGERKLDLLMIPTVDFKEMKEAKARIRLKGHVPHYYTEKVEVTGIPATWMSPIGGVLSNVSPKHKGDIKLDEKVEKVGKKSVQIGGRVSPHIKKQAVRVRMVRPDGAMQYEISHTDRRGRFNATFYLADKHAGKPGKDKDRNEKKQSECFEFQAEIFNATQIAPTASQAVCIKLDD